MLKNIYKLFISSFILLTAGYFVYFKNYNYPQKPFWDENYHIASAYKYLNNTFFLEPHPPLGKLLIALGEKILHPNDKVNTEYFLKTDYIKKFPKNFKFDGVRFIPALAGWFNVVLFFLILYFLTDKIFFSFLGSFLYLFDNALIVHSRAAMLESIQIFFILMSILIFVYMYKKNKLTYFNYILLGILISLAVMVKLNSLIIILLYIPLIYKEFLNKKSISQIILKLITSVISFLIIVLLIFKIHFLLTKNIVDNRIYHLNKNEISLFKDNKLNLMKEIKIYFRYIKIYEKGVPKYNPCKKNENGSLVLTWPLMDKTINYRWHKTNEKTQYLYLIGNPIVWLCGLVAVILSLAMVISRFVYSLPVKKEKFEYIFIFTVLYVSYMIAVLQIERVMYLYHYFIPLIFSLILFNLQIEYIFEDEINNKDLYFWSGYVLLILLVIFCWWWFSPFTYYEYMNMTEFNQRNWFEFWHLKGIY